MDPRSFRMFIPALVCCLSANAAAEEVDVEIDNLSFFSLLNDSLNFIADFPLIDGIFATSENQYTAPSYKPFTPKTAEAKPKQKEASFYDRFAAARIQTLEPEAIDSSSLDLVHFGREGKHSLGFCMDYKTKELASSALKPDGDHVQGYLLEYGFKLQDDFLVALRGVQVDYQGETSSFDFDGTQFGIYTNLNF